MQFDTVAVTAGIHIKTISLHMIRYLDFVSPDIKSQSRLSAFVIILRLSIAWNNTILLSSSIHAIFSLFIFLNSFQNLPDKCRQQRKYQKRDRKRYQPSDKQHDQHCRNSNHKKNSFRDSPCSFECQMNKIHCKYNSADYRQCDHTKSFFREHYLSFGRVRF